jgi:ElaB/YqjD/DUF883 family membrane-anchored ribosome-binding protein
MDKPDKDETKQGPSDRDRDRDRDPWLRLRNRLQSDLKDIGQGIEQALKDAVESPTGKKVVQAVKEAQPRMESAVKQVVPEVKRVVDQVKPTAKKVVEQVGPEVKKVVDQAKPVVREAWNELFGKSTSDKPVSREPQRSNAPPNISPDLFRQAGSESDADVDDDAGESDADVSDADANLNEDDVGSPSGVPRKTLGHSSKTKRPQPNDPKTPKRPLGKKKPTEDV